jgi:hypothetical protein
MPVLNENGVVYDMIDVAVTLRCNNFCINCIRFCNMESVTGLDYKDSDMSLDQIEKFITQVEKLDVHPLIGTVMLTGGEPLLHKDIITIYNSIKSRLVDTGLIKDVLLNSNLKMKPPAELQKAILNYVPFDKKAEEHNVVLLHPDDMKKRRMTFDTCNHYRKWRPVLSMYGYNMCCGALGYIDLFELDSLFIQELPDDPNKFPVKDMDLVCQHCPFPFMGSNSYLERCLGRPVSKIYKDRAEKNREEKRVHIKF